MSPERNHHQRHESRHEGGRQPELGTIRMLLGGDAKQREVDERITLTDADIVALVEKGDQAAQGSHRAVQRRRPQRSGGQGNRRNARCSRLIPAGTDERR